MTAANVTAVYDTVQQKVVMLVMDAGDLTDPSFNPPNGVQVEVDPAVYNSLETTEEIFEYIDQLCRDIGFQMQP